ncbi:hypothetical protein LPJ57_009473, partial [Coemansia sp. RSA 486]
MDGDPQRLRTHDFTVLATLGLTALYNDVGLRLEEERAYRPLSSNVDGHENGTPVFSSPRTPHRQTRKGSKRRSQLHGAEIDGGGGGSSSIGNMDGRKRKSAFEGNPESSGTV